MVATLKKRIGLLGGSFNPAHEGHVYISEKAIDLLKLDEIWWLVSPKNPQKENQDLMPFKVRLEGAENLTEGKPIKVSDFEHRTNLSFTIDTLEKLKTEFPDKAFVWLMGADCFLNFHTWKNWEGIAAIVPLAVFPRPGFTEDALKGKAAKTLSKKRLPLKEAENLMMTNPPAWVYIDIEPVSISATGIRNDQKG